MSRPPQPGDEARQADADDGAGDWNGINTNNHIVETVRADP
jgi:hypothetical protein